jgi:hypothetical protein
LANQARLNADAIDDALHLERRRHYVTHGHRWKLAGAIAGLAFWAAVLWLIFR